MGILIALVSGFAGGVFLRSLFVFNWEPVAFVLILATIIFIVPKLLSMYSSTPLERESPSFLTGLGAVFCLCVAFGMMRSALADTPLPESFAQDVRHRVSYEGIVVTDPDMRDANQRVEIQVSKGDASTRVLAVAPRSTNIAVGDRVNVSGTLLVPEAFADDNGRIFRYDKYLERDGVRFILNFAFIRVVEESSWYSLPALLARIKHSFLDGLATTLPEPYASLAGGIVIGGKSGLGSELKGAFTRSGLVHIIVLSGYNVMVVAEWVIAALALTKLPKRWGAFVGVCALLIFVGIAGASTTAIRAAFMALIALYARATGRTYAAGRALLIVVFLMLLWNPLYLVFDPGFGLSVAATAGLIWLAPIIETLIEKMRGKKIFESYLLSAPQEYFYFSKPEYGQEKLVAVPPVGGAERSQKSSSSSNFWKSAVATTLAAQISVFPLLLYNTGNLSLVAIPANLLVAPLMPLAMGLSALASFAGMFFGHIAPFLGIVLGFPAYLVNAYLIFIAQESAALPFAAFTLPPFPFWLVLVAYVALIFIASSKRFSTMLQLRFAKKASI